MGHHSLAGISARMAGVAMAAKQLRPTFWVCTTCSRYGPFRDARCCKSMSALAFSDRAAAELGRMRGWTAVSKRDPEWAGNFMGCHNEP